MFNDDLELDNALKLIHERRQFLQKELEEIEKKNADSLERRDKAMAELNESHDKAMIELRNKLNEMNELYDSKKKQHDERRAKALVSLFVCLLTFATSESNVLHFVWPMI